MRRPYLRVTSIQITPGSPFKRIPSTILDRSSPTPTSTELLDIQAQPGFLGSYELRSGNTSAFFRFKKSSSSTLPSSSSAERRTFPDTTQTPIKFPISAISIRVKVFPSLLLNSLLIDS